MTVKRHPNKKRIIVTKEDGEIYKIFDTVEECAEYFGKSKAVIHNRCAKFNVFYLENEVKIKFEAERKEPRTKEKVELTRSDVVEKKLRATETEDQTRRRLGLNPYGEWRNDEWLFAMFDRVNKQLYPDGYDEHAAWLSMKGKERMVKGTVRVAQEIIEEGYKDIDEEFLDYIK